MESETFISLRAPVIACTYKLSLFSKGNIGAGEFSEIPFKKALALTRNQKVHDV